MEDDGGNAYPPSESYVSSYVSSEDDDGRPARSIHPRAAHSSGGSDPDSGGAYSSRHSAHRSGREGYNSGARSGYSGNSGNSGGSSSRHSGARSGFDNGGSAEYDDEDMGDSEYYSEEAPSGRGGGRGAPLTDLDETHEGQRW